MKLFYSYTENRSLKVVSPRNTFGTISKTEFKAVAAVQPYKYRTVEGVSKEFKPRDFKNCITRPSNNGHTSFEVNFADDFNEGKGCIIYFRIIFADASVHNGVLPFTNNKSISATGSTETEDYSISFNTNVNVSYYSIFNGDISKVFTETSFTPDLDEYIEQVKGCLEFIGVASKAGGLEQHLTRNNGKFITSDVFVNNESGIADDCVFFFGMLHGAALDIDSSLVYGCTDPLASNYTSAANINNNTCVYTNRAPSNITITYEPGNTTKNPGDIIWEESNLPASLSDIDDFTSLTFIDTDANTSTPASSAVYGKSTGEYTLRAVWTNTELSTIRQINYVTASVSVIGDSVIRAFRFLPFSVAAAGCSDSNAVNYDSNADNSCPECCVYCQQVQSYFNNLFSVTVAASSNAGESGVSSTVMFQANVQAIAQQDATVTAFYEYLSTQAVTSWELAIYAQSEVNVGLPGEQATIIGSAIASATSSGSPLIPNFVGNVTLTSGQNYYAEVKLTLGSCVTYAYILFTPQYNGCLDPLSSSFDPAPGNNGGGICLYDDAPPLGCQGSITYNTTLDLVQAGNAMYTLNIVGTEIDQDYFGDYSYFLTIEDEVISPQPIPAINNTATIQFGVPQGVPFILTILDNDYGCIEEVIFENDTANLPELGCTDPDAANYNPDAEQDNGGCVYCQDFAFITLSVADATSTSDCVTTKDGGPTFKVIGVGSNMTITVVPILAPSNAAPLYTYPNVTSGTNTDAATSFYQGVYEATLTIPVGAGEVCTLTQIFVVESSSSTCGCTNPDAINYDPAATIDSGYCLIEGCTDSAADNYNENATISGECFYSIDEPEALCIPYSVNNVNYDDVITSLKMCVSRGGKVMLNRIKGGLDPCIKTQQRLSMISYLLNKIGLDCLYNCNYTYPQNNNPVNCEALWEVGGPSGNSLTVTESSFATTNYLNGDIIQYELNGSTNYYIKLGNGIGGPLPPQELSWSKCKSQTLPTGTQTYLESFINFVTKSCRICMVGDTTQASTEQTPNTNNGITSIINLEP